MVKIFGGVIRMKKILDAALLIVFFVGLSSNFMSARVHEAAGIIFVVGVVAHNVLNRGFYKNFLRGKFNRRRVVNHATIIFFALNLRSRSRRAERFNQPPRKGED